MSIRNFLRNVFSSPNQKDNIVSEILYIGDNTNREFLLPYKYIFSISVIDVKSGERIYPKEVRTERGTILTFTEIPHKDQYLVLITIT